MGRTKRRSHSLGEKTLEPTQSTSASTFTHVSPSNLPLDLHLPPFMADDVELWFTQVESNFISYGISDDSKRFHLVVGKMESKVVKQVADLTKNPPAADKYETLKKKLVKIYSESEEKKLNRLLDDLELGDRKPSHLFREIESLANGKYPEQLLKSLWLKWLPNDVRKILAGSSDLLPMEKLATMADNIMDVPHFQTASIAKTKTIAQPSELQELKLQLAAVIQRLDENDKHNTHYSRSRSRSGSRSRPRRRTPLRGKPEYKNCYYHYRFSLEAKKCEPPCAFRPCETCENADTGNGRTD